MCTVCALENIIKAIGIYWISSSSNINWFVDAKMEWVKILWNSGMTLSLMCSSKEKQNWMVFSNNEKKEDQTIQYILQCNIFHKWRQTIEIIRKLKSFHLTKIIRKKHQTHFIKWTIEFSSVRNKHQKRINFILFEIGNEE